MVYLLVLQCFTLIYKRNLGVVSVVKYNSTSHDKQQRRTINVCVKLNQG